MLTAKLLFPLVAMLPLFLIGVGVALIAVRLRRFTVLRRIVL